MSVSVCRQYVVNVLIMSFGQQIYSASLDF